MKSKRASNYVTTVYPGDIAGLVALDEIRKAVKVINADLKQNPNVNYSYRVCLRGRLGRNNPAAADYRRGGSRNNDYTGSSYQSILKKDAVRFDVYISQR